MFYISPRDQGIYSYPEEGINYGISHFQENGREPVAGFRVVDHPVRKSAFTGKKPRFMDEANTARSPRAFTAKPVMSPKGRESGSACRFPSSGTE